MSQTVSILPHSGFVRLNRVLEFYPVSRSTWWNGVKSGRYPKPYKLGPNTTAWKCEDIHKLLAEIEGEAQPNA